jgi:hypothetical protein
VKLIYDGFDEDAIKVQGWIISQHRCDPDIDAGSL